MQFKVLLDIFLSNWTKYLAYIAIMIGAVIFVIGALKPKVFDKIKNKNVRKCLLFLTSIVLSFAAVAIYFVVEAVPFKYFPLSGAAVACACILAYSGYENFFIRVFIDWIKKTIRKSITYKELNKLDGKDREKATGILYQAGKEAAKDTEAVVAKKTDDYLKNL